MERLPAAQVGVDYITNLQTLGGNPDTTRFSVVAGSVLLDGVAQPDLEYNGLTLFEDGTLAGRPLASGTLNFTARAANGTALARDHSNTMTDQPLAIVIAPQAAVQSLLATTSAQIKGDRVRPTKGFLNLRAIVNVDGYGQRDFAGGRLVLRVGGATYSATLDSRGRARSDTMRASLSTFQGLLNVQLRGVDMTERFDPRSLVRHMGKTVVVEMELGTTFRATEAIEFDVQRASSNGFTMQYKLGRQRQLGGLFQITRIRGRNDFDGTAYQTNFLVSHVKGRSELTFGYAREATVFIGPEFRQTVTLHRGSGRFFPPGVRKLRIDPGHKLGSLETYSLSSQQTGIARPSNGAGEMQTFLLSLDLVTNTTFFSGDASQRIFPFARTR
jgi:hypothetical protein